MGFFEGAWLIVLSPFLFMLGLMLVPIMVVCVLLVFACVALIVVSLAGMCSRFFGFFFPL